MKYLMGLLTIIALTTPALAQDSSEISLEVIFTRTNGTIQAVGARDTAKVEFAFAEIRKSANQILIRDRVLISGDSLFVGNRVFALDTLTPYDVNTCCGGFKLTLAKQEERAHSRRAVDRFRYASFQKVNVPPGDFVRGNVFCVGGEAVIEGEVNGYVVALFGDVRLTSAAICQRDVFAIGGEIHKHRQARVYGTYQSTESWQQAKVHYRKKGTADKSAVHVGLDASYTRVDGLSLIPSVTFQSEEKLLPKFFFKYGYGFTSKVSKYQLGFEQTLFDVNQTKFGGSVYRVTDTEDDWICDESENNLYALLIREDFRDYYQAEGGKIFAEQSIDYNHTFRLEYSYEALGNMMAHPRLWSLFGGDKRFRDNFSSVDQERRNDGLEYYSTKNEAVLTASYVLNTVEDQRGSLARAGWVAGVEYEHSSIQLGSDFDYDRYTLELRRYQPLTYIQNLNVRLLYGGASGTLPLHRLFYLGGIRTLRAYGIKQFYGSHVALADAEYVVNFPKSDVGVALLFDMGKTGWNNNFLSKGGWHGDVGIGFRASEYLRLEVTRQINGDTDKLQLSALIGRSF